MFGNWAAESTTGTVASGPVIAIAFFVPTMLLLLGDANVYQRIFSARDGKSARKAVAFWVIGVIVLESAISFFGLVGSVAAEQGLITDLAAQGKDATETVIPVVAREALPLALGMMLVGTMMAIVVSTADSFLLVPATNLTRDVYQRYINPSASDRTIVATSRTLVLVLGVIAYLLVDQFPTILSAAYTAYVIYGASITPALLAAFLWRRATKSGAIASILTGAGITLIWKYGLSEDYVSSMHPMLAEVAFPATGLSFLALIVVSLMTPAPSEEVWGKFFDDGPTQETA